MGNIDDDNLSDKISSEETRSYFFEFENDLDDLDNPCTVDLNKIKIEDDIDNVKLEVNNITSELEDLQHSELCENIPGCHDLIEIVKHEIQVEEHSDVEEQVLKENNEVNENDDHNNENEEHSD